MPASSRRRAIGMVCGGGGARFARRSWSSSSRCRPPCWPRRCGGTRRSGGGPPDGARRRARDRHLDVVGAAGLRRALGSRRGRRAPHGQGAAAARPRGLEGRSRRPAGAEQHRPSRGGPTGGFRARDEEPGRHGERRERRAPHRPGVRPCGGLRRGGPARTRARSSSGRVEAAPRLLGTPSVGAGRRRPLGALPAADRPDRPAGLRPRRRARRLAAYGWACKSRVSRSARSSYADGGGLRRPRPR